MGACRDRTITPWVGTVEPFTFINISVVIFTSIPSQIEHLLIIRRPEVQWGRGNPPSPPPAGLGD